MRRTTSEILDYYINQMSLSGKVLEIGGHKLSKCAIKCFPKDKFEYFDLNLKNSDITNTIIADITSCKDQISDESFDIVFSSDVFEHIKRPWLAAEEIHRILKPGGLAFTFTLWSWRNHPCPIDYWRFSPECLEFLFSNLTCLEKGYDLSQRRRNNMGFWGNGRDSVPIDFFGGWRENWACYHIGVKNKSLTQPPVQFKKTSNKYAKLLQIRS